MFTATYLLKTVSQQGGRYNALLVLVTYVHSYAFMAGKMKAHILSYTVNGERFAGLNFPGFRSF